MTEEEIKAMIKQAWDVPITATEAEAAKRGWAGMSDWQTMTFLELDRLIDEEEKARKA
jgi:hypothetical protein